MNFGKSEISGLFGHYVRVEEADLVVIPAPWGVSSANVGSVFGPEGVLESSLLVEDFSGWSSGAAKVKMALLPMPYGWKLKSDQLRAGLGESAVISGEQWPGEVMRRRVDQYSYAFKKRVRSNAVMQLDKGKMVGVLGGEQICALGLMEACGKREKQFGILHIDAHADLWKQYQGLEYSHASVMYHALKIPSMVRLVQVGLRSYGAQERALIEEDERVVAFKDADLKRALFEGTAWGVLCDRIVAELPDKVYISFDIDGLDPELCPHTSRPVPGGLTLEQVLYLIEKVVASGRELIGFDLSEVGFDSENNWDGVVGARVLYYLGAFMAESRR